VVHQSEHASAADLEADYRFDQRSTAALALVLLASALLVAVFHNKFWAPADEGNYAHVAERLLSGEVLHLDIQDVHAGYVDFVNAAAFSLFGVRLVSLRYPLVILAVIQSGLAFLLLRPRGLAAAVIGALAATSLGFIQFLNPTANWYCLFLALATVCWLRWVPSGRRERDLGTGFLVGTTFLFRQLSGVLLAMGVLVFLVLERPPSPGEKRVGLARALLLLVTGGLAVYLVRATDALGWLLLGVWPFPVLLHAWRRTAAPNRELLGTLFAVVLGAVFAALPLIAYLTVHGATQAWLSDTFGAAVALPSLDFVKRPGYLMMGILALRGLMHGDVAARLNGIFWLSLLLLTGVLGVALLRTLLRRSATSGIHPLPIVALFYALVAVHYQIPIYLFCTIGLSLLAVLWHATARRSAPRIVALSAATVLAVIGVYYQAAMSLNRGLEGIVAGERRPAVTPLRLARGGLYVDAEDAAQYRRLVELIEQETHPGDTILALPSNAELYFLTGRTNPFRFYNSAVGIRSSADLESTLRVVRCHPPKLVFYNLKDKYNTAASERIGDSVQVRYDAVTPLPPFQVFRRRNIKPEGSTDPGCP
jgi:hypothetical protein